MADRDGMTRAMFAALVDRVGGCDVAAAILEARHGVGCKGTISRMCSGSIGVTVDAMCALEDNLRAFPLTEMLSKRRLGVASNGGDIHALTAESILVAGQAHAALVQAISAGGEHGALIGEAEAGRIVAAMSALRDLADAISGHAQRCVAGGVQQGVHPANVYMPIDTSRDSL